MQGKGQPDSAAWEHGTRAAVERSHPRRRSDQFGKTGPGRAPLQPAGITGAGHHTAAVEPILFPQPEEQVLDILFFTVAFRRVEHALAPGGTAARLHDGHHAVFQCPAVGRLDNVLMAVRRPTQDHGRFCRHVHRKINHRMESDAVPAGQHDAPDRTADVVRLLHRRYIVLIFSLAHNKTSFP